MRDFLTRPLTIWALFFATLIITFTIGLVIPNVSGTFIDMVSDPKVVSSLIARMSEEQKQTHFWATLLLDTAYPLAYGGFFAGMTLRYFGQRGKWLSLPALSAVLVDLVENTIQMLALRGNEDMLWIKAFLTPVKFSLSLVAGLIALVALGIAIYYRLNRPAG